MALYKPDELREYLNQIGASPKRTLSQNFLIDGNVVEKIVDFAKVDQKSSIIEIGPGPGVLTEAMLAHGAKQLIAIEKDDLFANGLKRFSGAEVLHSDVLDVDFEKILSTNKCFKVVANLPYHLTTPILEKLLPLRSYIESITVMVQLEAANRFLSKPKTKNWSAFPVILNLFSTPIWGFKVSRNSFWPKPNVDSAVIQFVLKDQPVEDSLVEFVKFAFAHKRKTLVNNLSIKFSADSVKNALTALKKDPKIRAEALSAEDFKALHQSIRSPHSA